MPFSRLDTAPLQHLSIQLLKRQLRGLERFDLQQPEVLDVARLLISNLLHLAAHYFAFGGKGRVPLRGRELLGKVSQLTLGYRAM